MKIVHLSDLHLGKRVNEYSMIEDQRYILGSIADIIKKEAPDCVLIAGDVYDKSSPSAEAVELFDDFLVQLSELGTEIFVISGNHDSAERIAFGRKFMEHGGVHMSPVYKGNVDPYIMNDGHGEVAVYMLPYVKPSSVRGYFPDKEILTYTDAVRTAIEEMRVDTGRRNVLVAHQFVTGGERTGSEELSVGGMDNVDAEVFKCFDYVALGHLHRPQKVSRKGIRYAGTPLKYSFSEINDIKSVTVVELGADRKPEIHEIPLTPKYDIVELREKFDTLMQESFYAGKKFTSDYTHIILTDENDIPDAEARLRVVYRRIMKIDYDNARTRLAEQEVTGEADVFNKDPLTLFAEFYKERSGEELSEEQMKYVTEVIGQIWGDGDK